MEYDSVKPGHDVAVMTGFRRPLYGRRHPRKDKGAARIMRMKHEEFQEVDKLRKPKNYFKNMKKAMSEEPVSAPVVHKVKIGKKIGIEVEPIFQTNPIQAYMRELEKEHKDQKARMVEDDMKLEKFIQKHKELVSQDALDSQKVIDNIVSKRHSPATATTTTKTNITGSAEPFVVENYEYRKSSGVLSSKPVDDGLDPTLKKKIKQSKDELADLEYDLTHRPPSSLRGRGTGMKLDVTSGGSGTGRGSCRFSEWDDVDLYGLVDDMPSTVKVKGTYVENGDYPGSAVRALDEDYYPQSEVNLPWLILIHPSTAAAGFL